MRTQNPEPRTQNKRPGFLFLITGPSGSGKTTLAQRALGVKEFKGSVAKSVSFTTRPRRTKERQERDYFFITPAQFRANIKEKKIIEWTRYLGYYYGTSREFVQDVLGQGKHLVLCLDLKGVRAMEKLFPDSTVSIFVEPPSIETLSLRIENRCRHTKKEEIKKRLRLARRELMVRHKFSYRILNQDLHQATEELIGIIKSHIRKEQS